VLDAVYPSSQVGKHLPDDLQIAVRRIHVESYALSAKPASLARYLSGLVYFIQSRLTIEDRDGIAHLRLRVAEAQWLWEYRW
jgi:hypothetical protein